MTQPDCCDTGFYYNSSTCLCEMCSDPLPGCISCTDETSCLSCNTTGYYLNISDCFVCSDTMRGCLNCINSTVCTGCNNAEGFYF